MKKMKKWMAGILATLVMLAALPIGIVVTAAPATGSGTEGDPYIITSEAELTELATAVNAGTDQTGVYYRLGNDIVLSSTTSIGDYSGGTAKRFNGVFDGNNFTISGVSITSGNYAGLFGHIGADGVVRNLNVVGSVSSSNNAGGICGRNNGLLENCTFSGTVTGTTSGKQIGGIAAANGGTIRNCKTIAGASNYVQGSAGVRTGGIVGFLDAGGLVWQCVNEIKIVGSGENGTAGGIVGLINAASGVVRACINRGTIQAGTKGTWDSKKTGGIVGSGYGTITSCYNTGTMTGYNVSGLIGNAYSGMTVEGCYSVATLDGTRNGGIINTNSGATFTNCYYLNGDYAWFQDGSNNGDLAGATQKTAGQMKTADFVSALNATNSVWMIKEDLNSGFPVLAFEVPHVELTIAEKKAMLLDYLADVVSAGKILSGQHSRKENMTAVDQLINATGKYPAILAIDFMSYTVSDDYIAALDLETSIGRSTKWECEDNVGITEAAIDYIAANGGFLSASWHWFAPGNVGENKSFYNNNTYGKSNYNLTAALADTSSAAYTALISDIDAIAAELQKLEDAGIVVLWRPLHEPDKGFWWGESGSSSYIALWNLMYDRLVNVKGLENLIWVWSAGEGGNCASYYPGSSSVDIVGVDVYDQSVTAEMAAMASFDSSTDLVALSEFDNFSKLQTLLDANTGAAWALYWNEIDYYPEQQTLAATAYADSNLITLDEVPYQTRWFVEESILANGSGTEADPFLVQTKDDLQTIANTVNDGKSLSGIYFQLCNNIALSSEWMPIGCYASKTAFQGNFDGNGYTISGLSISSPTIDLAGLFGYVGTTGVIKDLTVAGTLSGAKSLGGIVGRNDGTISDCSFSGTITTSLSSGEVGGIAAENGGLIENCSATSGTFTGGASGRAGGIAGYNDTSSGIISQCINSASIVIGGTAYPALGGIVGSCNNSSVVQYCINRGTVTGGAKGTWSGHNNGGIAGGLANGSSVISCYNVGAVNGYYAGGLVGNNATGCTVSGSYSAGTFDATRAGGVLSKTNGGTVTNCYYLNTVANAYYYSDGAKGDVAGATAMSAADMKISDFAIALNQTNDAWTIRTDLNSGYPVLSFEVDYTLNILGASVRYINPTGIRFGASIKKNDDFKNLWGNEEYHAT